MNSDTSFALVACTAIIAYTVLKYVDREAGPMNPVTACVQEAHFQSDRIECLNAAPKVEPSK